jgi:hypothetical protein
MPAARMPFATEPRPEVNFNIAVTSLSHYRVMTLIANNPAVRCSMEDKLCYYFLSLGYM